MQEDERLELLDRNADSDRLYAVQRSTTVLLCRKRLRRDSVSRDEENEAK
jgi:hypothetical protein